MFQRVARSRGKWVKNPPSNARHHSSWRPYTYKTNTNNPSHNNSAGGHAAPTGYATIAFKYAGISNAGSLASTTAAGAPDAPPPLSPDYRTFQRAINKF